MEDNKIELLLTIKKNQLRMIRDRGYDISDDLENVNNKNDFLLFLQESVENKKDKRKSEKFVYKDKQRIKPQIDFRFVLTNNYKHETEDKKLSVIYLGKYYSEKLDNINLDDIFYYLKTIKNIPDELILIKNTNLTSHALNALEIFVKTKNISYQIFNDYELFYSPIKFIDYSKHTLIPLDEEESLLKEMRVIKSKMLLIGLNDPIVKYYNWPEGRIVRIERHDLSLSILAKKSINYRVIRNLHKPKEENKVSKKQLIEMYKKDKDSWEL